MKYTSLVIAVCSCLGWAGRTEAQFYWGAATTPDAAAGEAIAAMIQSEGMYNQMTSAAMVNVEAARGKYIENQRKWTELYLIQRRVLAAQRAEAIEIRRAKNAQYLEEMAARHSHLPPRLYSAELDASTGKIAWPSALKRDAFITQRGKIEDLLASRAKSGSTSEISSALASSTLNLHDELRQHIREIVPQEYMEARRFIDSLSLEGKHPIVMQASLE